MTKVCPFCGAEFDENRADPGQRPGTLICPTCFQEVDGPKAAEFAEAVAPPAQTAAPDPAGPAGEAPPPPEEPAAPRMPPPPAPEPGRAMPNPCDAPPPYTGDPADAPAWELDGGFFTRIWVTAWQMLLHPVRTMAAPPRQDGLGAPLAFGIILGTFGGIAMAFWQRVFPVQGMEATAGLWRVILLPLTNLAGIFITAAVAHVFLWIFRGTRRGFKGTFRAVSYSNAANLFMLIPGFGMYAAGVWGFICLVGGLSGSHATGKARVFLGLVVPLVVLILLVIALAVFFGLGAMLGATGAMMQQGAPFSF